MEIHKENEGIIDSEVTGIDIEDQSLFEDDLRKEFEEKCEKLGFSPQEFHTCLKVLKCFSTNLPKLHEKEFKELRITGSKIFIEGVRNQLFDGLAEHEYRKQRASKQEIRRREQIKKELDKQYINSRKLRMERLESYNKLLEVTKEEVLLITDGKKDADRLKISANMITEKPSEDVTSSTEPVLLTNPRSCYICKCRFFELHFFYDNLCPTCAALSYEKRNQKTDLNGYVAIVTGGRIKIGYECALILLRCGATVIVTTRFPKDSAIRFSKEKDFSDWKDRLHIYGLDMRNLKSVEEFVQAVIEKFDRLDILINNACQTVRKPPAFYKHLMPTEMTPINSLPESVQPLLYFNERTVTARIETSSTNNIALLKGSDDKFEQETNKNVSITPSAALSQVALLSGDDQYDELAFPKGKLDVHNQQIDLRTNNTWLMKLEEIPTIELVEVTTINQLAPFILCSKLKPLMLQSPKADKYIVNVSAMEGKFYRHKTANHPHTNMAKAALNMMTRTSAQDYASDRIWMTSVDTGWITDESPFLKASEYAKSANFVCPLDEIEAAARILDPVFTGIKAGVNHFGKFFKDYHETEW